jgi:hypothetical protein
VWRPLVRIISPSVRILGGAASALGRVFARRGTGGTAESPQDELRLVVD